MLRQLRYGRSYSEVVTRTISRWWPTGVILLGAVAVWVAWSGVVGIVSAVLLIGYAWMVSPAFFPRSADLPLALERAAAGEAPLVFWKPGCTFCIRMRLGVGAAGRRVSWVDSSIDSQARAMVRSQNGGDHTTPTVMFGDESRTNPDVGWVRTLLH